MNTTSMIAAGALACAIAAMPHAAAAATPAQSVSETPMSDAVANPPVPNLRRPGERLMTGGQPAATAWKQLANEGVTTVINLRPDVELEGRDEAAEVAAAGLGYRQIPVAGSAGITADNADALWSAISQSSGQVLVHCASGNRVGALLAIGAARQGGKSPEQALEFGKQAGLTGAEPRVRELLGLPPKE
ncbi:beta-lactamase hydrolase domain-containing protein [Lysobacter niastensis]|uniref:Protein tyrosine phosphatase family protein n=1 Tax=Lysobacter niastensis TaxID=380629 RepID=A0ABS0B1U5_9GAMM|nr:protein tyrosine phosphatase family protein [Lysobacter niastensis]MBF6022459.1 protein tyrosine phosphatase family protein [Lysobacter niastensis]